MLVSEDGEGFHERRRCGDAGEPLLAIRGSLEGRGAELMPPEAEEFREPSEGSLERVGGGAHAAKESPRPEDTITVPSFLSGSGVVA